MEYQFLTDSDKQELVRQRILALEADHYKLELLIQECADPDRCAKLIEQQGVLSAAIDVHLDEHAAATAASP